MTQLLPLLPLLLLLLLLLAALATGQKQQQQLHVVVVDAGSTGTRAMVYRLRRSEDSFGYKMLDYKRYKGSSALSSFVNSPERCGDMLRKLFDAAANDVPPAERSSTWTIVRATAGLRQMRAGARRRIVAAAERAVTASGFRRPPPGAGGVRVLSGADEGKFAWAGVNLLLGNRLAAGGARPLMEMGGGSLQVAYRHQAAGDVSLRLSGGARLRLRVASYSGLGNDAGFLRMLGHSAEAAANGARYSSPCLAAGVEFNFTYGSVRVHVTCSSNGTRQQRAADCLRGAAAAVAGAGVVAETKLTSDPSAQPLYAISAVFYSLRFLAGRQNTSVTTVNTTGRGYKAFAATVGGLRRDTLRLCQDPPASGKYKPYYCKSLALTSAVLAAVGLGNQSRLLALGGNHAIGWTLGAGVDFLNEMAASGAAAAAAAGACRSLLPLLLLLLLADRVVRVGE